MTGLGFGRGYAAQGGDIGSFVTNALGVYHEECKLIHLNFRLLLGKPTGSTPSPSSTQQSQPPDPLLPHNAGCG
ncbi:hypothetical protein L198_07885 [Cryptococcus wingfieldii CBS 7118]|uniref:Uncharacterized protein n=1 Tax=Cryptococcus wingfieldii CBS 7118 TaxID=1295528 RepID=A0A1E3HV77_9TREE|nr:hypothetical protein L198_07885 [Cryptococcus wingfieldii CBS 7118]ODN80075.1 hypothetical protein L198_07885 [Cryptococcus wingfieldii CBS 7118]